MCIGAICQNFLDLIGGCLNLSKRQKIKLSYIFNDMIYLVIFYILTALINFSNISYFSFSMYSIGLSLIIFHFILTLFLLFRNNFSKTMNEVRFNSESLVFQKLTHYSPLLLYFIFCGLSNILHSTDSKHHLCISS